jgi:hypothetical protein
VDVVNEDNPGQALRNQVVVVSNMKEVNDVNEDRNVNNLEQVLLSLEEENVDHRDVDVNNGNETVNNSEQVLLSQEVLLVNVNHVDVDVNVNAEALDVNNVNENVKNPKQGLLVNLDHVDVDVNIETEENVDVDANVNVNRTKVRSIEAVVCELQRAREQELLRARNMRENYERGSCCPVYTKGNGFKLRKQEVEAWKICVETPENKTRLAVDMAINLPHGHPLKIKERVLDPTEFGVLKLTQ